MHLYIGCPVWAYKGWVGNFYPAGTRSGQYLPEYAQRLTTVEGNTTFYAVPGPNTVQGWANETPQSFRFCFKLPRTISHAGKLVDHIDDAVRFAGDLQPLGPRLGPMFLQLPPQYSPLEYEDLQAFLEAWPEDVRLAVEVRHLRWFMPAFYERLNALLARFNMARVTVDTRPIQELAGQPVLKGSVYARLVQARQRKPDLPVLPNRTANFTFLRFIGHPEPEKNAPFMDEWVDYLAGLPQDGSQAYIFCHCPVVTMAPWICREFYARAAKALQLPPLPWDAVEADPGQPNLL